MLCSQHHSSGILGPQLCQVRSLSATALRYCDSGPDHQVDRRNCLARVCSCRYPKRRWVTSSVKFHHATQDDAEFKMYELLVSGHFHSIFWMHFTLRDPKSQKAWVKRETTPVCLSLKCPSQGLIQLMLVGAQLLALLWRFVVSCDWDQSRGLPGSSSWMFDPFLVLPEFSDFWFIKMGPS